MSSDFSMPLSLLRVSVRCEESGHWLNWLQYAIFFPSLPKSPFSRSPSSIQSIPF